MTINQRFKKIREVLGMTQAVFAEKLDTVRANIASIETGKQNPPFTMVSNLHIKLGINLNWLICGTGKMKDDISMNYSVNEPNEPYNAEMNDLLRENNKLLKHRVEELEQKIEELEGKNIVKQTTAKTYKQNG